MKKSSREAIRLGPVKSGAPTRFGGVKRSAQTGAFLHYGIDPDNGEPVFVVSGPLVKRALRATPYKSQAAARLAASAVTVPTDDPLPPHGAAYEPDARAKAILRGKQQAQADLKANGGAYTLDQVRTLLNGISRQAVNKKVQDGHLLTVPGPGDDHRYPTVQFASDGQLVPGLKAVQHALLTKSPWAIFNFMIQPDALLNGRKPIDVLKEGNVDLVVEVARRYGEMGS